MPRVFGTSAIGRAGRLCLLIAASIMTAGVAHASSACTLEDIEQLFHDVVARVQPSVVAVIAYSGISPDASGEEGELGSLKKHVGSGVIVDDLGHVLTTTSVVGNSRQLSVRTYGGRQLAAVRVGVDPVSKLVLLAVKGLEHDPAQVGSSAGLAPGSWLITVGQGEGAYPSSAFGTFAAISARSAPPVPGGLIHLTAPVFPGQTGGAVVNLAGELVGVLLGPLSREGITDTSTTGEAASLVGLASDLSVAIPIDTAREVARQLDVNGTVSPGFLGVSVQVPAEGLRVLLKIEEGVLIKDVLAGSPADAAAIEVGDIIVSFDGETVNDPAELANLVSAHRPGDRCLVGLMRGDIPLQRQVTLSATPASYVTRRAAGQ
jgi:S1-C subfamily serine protease